jgi:hypothetical protein
MMGFGPARCAGRRVTGQLSEDVLPRQRWGVSVFIKWSTFDRFPTITFQRRRHWRFFRTERGYQYPLFGFNQGRADDYRRPHALGAPRPGP